MNNFQSFLDEADSYFRIVANSLAKNGKLGNKVMFSLSTMAIEKYLVAVLMAKGIKVSGHNLNSMVAILVKSFHQVPDEIKALAKADEKIDLCSFSPINSIEPTLDEMNKLQERLGVLNTFVLEQSQAAKPSAIG